jgi:hypothetical protein
MRLTLHDNIHASAGTPHPDSRPAISRETRAAWVRAMDRLVVLAETRGGSVAADFTFDGTKLRMRARRHGAAWSAAWSLGAEERVVAASVLLTGDVETDDAAALVEIRSRVPPLPFGDADYAGVGAEHRPCLATLYLDAAWYHNARIELAATALALAALSAADARLSVRAAGRPSSDTPPEPTRTDYDTTPTRTASGAGATPKFDFSRERLQLVLRMAKKKADAAIAALPGVHFRVYPPLEFLDHPGVLTRGGVFDRLRDTTWRVRWHDGAQDELAFGEFLGFIHQIVGLEKAFQEATGSVPTAHPAPQNHSVWQPTRRNDAGGRAQVRFRNTMNALELVRDETVRGLLNAVVLESTSSPPRRPESAEAPGRRLERFPTATRA